MAAIEITPGTVSSVFGLQMSVEERAANFVKYLEATAKLPVGQSDIPIKSVRELFSKAVENNKAAKLPVAEQNNYIISDLQLKRCLSSVGKTEAIMKRLASVRVASFRPQTCNRHSGLQFKIPPGRGRHLSRSCWLQN